MDELDFKDLQSSIADLTKVISELIPQMRGVKSTASVQRQSNKNLSDETLKLSEEYRELQNSVRTNNSLMSGMRNNLLAVGISYRQEIQLSKKKIQLRQSELADVQRSLAENSREITSRQQKLNGLKQEIVSSQQLRSEVTKQINAVKASISETRQNIDAIKAERTLREQSIATLREKLAAARDDVNYTKSSIAAAQEEKDAVSAHIDRLREKEDVQKSQIDAINSQIRAIRGSPSANKQLTDEEKSLIASLTKRKESVLQAFNETKEARKAEIAYRESLASTITSLQSTLGPLEDAEKSLADTLVDETLAHKKLTDALSVQESTLQQLTDEQAAAEKQYQTLTDQISKTIQAAGKESIAIQNATNAQNQFKKAVDEAAENLRTAKLEKLKTHIDKIGELRAPIDQLARFIKSFTDEIRKTQQQFGIAAGQAAKLKLENLTQSIESYINSLKSGFTKAGVSAEQIQTAQADFQAEFGGILTSEAAGELASQAKMMGVTTSQLAQARRVFMTQTMGDTGKAKAAQEKFIGEFTKKGLTAKDAMAAIGQNAELLARNGTRFASSFARAAADAKKIGVDLSKIDQVGDNIIGDFEGFLEKSAELGAMGFNLDTSKLADLAESGDTGALFNELRSQLAATGKDITKLRRSERMALESTFGINISELQRMGAEGTEGSGEQQKSIEDLQTDSNTLLSRIVTALEPLAGLLGGISKALELAQGALQIVLLTRIAANTSGMGLLGGGGNLASKAGGAIRGGLTAAGSTVPLGGGLTMGSTVSAAAGAGLTGAAAIGGTVAGGLGAGLAIGNMFNTSVKEGGSGTLGDWWNFAVGKSKEEKDAERKADEFAQSKGFKSMAEMLAAKRAQRGDDVISQPGYGKRSLLTPSGVIALNNRDNIIAYADDLMGTTKLPLGAITGQFAKLGEFEQRANKVFDGLSQSITGKFQGVKESIGNIFGSSSEGLLGKFNKLKESGGGFVSSIKEGALGKAKGLMDKFTGEGSMFSKAKGLFSGGVGGLKEKALGFASKVPGVGSLLSGGVGGLTDKIPGIANIKNVFSGFKEGGIAGGLKSLAGAGAGKMIGGALGTLIPIPGVGTMLGSIAGGAVGKGVGKAISGVGKLFGKGKDGKSMADKIAGYTPAGLGLKGLNKFADSKIGKFTGIGMAKKLATSGIGKSIVKYSPGTIAAKGIGKVLGKAAKVSPEMMTPPSPDLSTLLGPQKTAQQTIKTEQAPVKVDTAGIEQKLNNFINALQNVQINMDGNKVGKVLVNASEAALSAGVFRAQSG